MLGVRESRRIMGDYVLAADDLIAGRTFDDAVSMGGYHIDIHRPAGTWVESTTYSAGLPTSISMNAAPVVTAVS